MLVNRKKASVTTIAGVTLFPGNNTIEGPKADELRQHKDFLAQVAAGYMEEVAPKKVEAPESTESDSEETTDDITEMNSSDAIEVAKGCLHVVQLQKMLDAEEGTKNRKGVKAAIEAQMEKMREEDGDE